MKQFESLDFNCLLLLADKNLWMRCYQVTFGLLEIVLLFLMTDFYFIILLYFLLMQNSNLFSWTTLFL